MFSVKTYSCGILHVQEKNISHKGLPEKNVYMKMWTIKDVAREAGVSIATVSRALNSPDLLTPSTRKKVELAVKRLGYERNLIASSLKSRKSTLIGFIVADIQNPFFVRIIKSAERLLAGEGYTTIICDSEEDPEKEIAYIKDLFSRRIDGLIVIPSIEHNPIIQALKRRDVATVFVDRYLSDDFDCIKSNNYAGMSLLISHLVERGYTDIALIAGPLGTLSGRERYEAYLNIMRRYHLPVRESWVQISDFSLEGGYEAAQDLLADARRPETIIASNNLTGIGALRAIHYAGLSVPDDIGLVIFDEVMLGDVTRPPLTVVVQPAEEMGMEAAKLLIGRMKGTMKTPPQLIVHEPKLVVRRSTK